MKTSEKQLPSKANFSTFSTELFFFLVKTVLKKIRVTKTVNDFKFQGVWGELEGKIVSSKRVSTKCSFAF